MKKIFVSLVMLLVAAVSSFALDIVVSNNSDTTAIIQSLDPVTNKVIDETKVAPRSAVGYTIYGYSTINIAIGASRDKGAILFKGIDHDYVIYLSNDGGCNRMFCWR